MKGNTFVLDSKCDSLGLMLVTFLVLLYLFHRDFFDDIDDIVIEVLVCL